MRKSAVRLLLILAFAAATLLPVQAAEPEADYDWRQVKIGGGGFVTGIASHPAVEGLYYCRTDVGGAYRLSPGSDRWEQIVTSASVPAPLVRYTHHDGVDGIAVSRAAPDVVYAAYRGTVLRSSDRGRHFEPGNLAVAMDANDEGRYFERLTVDPVNANVAYLGTRRNGLWRTLDGKTWHRLPGVPEGADSEKGMCGIVRVLVDASAGQAKGRSKLVHVFVFGDKAGKGGVWRSADGGTTWTDISAPPGAGPGKTSPIRDANLAPEGRMICIEGRKAWLWSDPAWKDITPPGAAAFEDVAVDPADGKRIILTANNGSHYRSVDGGRRWIGPLPVVRKSPDVPWLAATDEKWFSTAEVIFDAHVKGRIWTAQGIGVWRSDDLTGKDSITWTAASKGIEELCCNDLIVPPGGSPVIAVWDRTAFRIQDADTYSAVQIPKPEFSSGWSLAFQPDQPMFMALTAYRHNWWFAKGDHSGWSDDGGKTWHAYGSVATGTHPQELRFGDVAVSAGNPDNIVRVPEADKLPYYTTDRGKTWTVSKMTKNGEPVTKGGYGGYFVKKKMLVADPSQPGTFLLYQWEHGLFRSTDGGKTFVLHSTQLPAWRWHPCLRAVRGKAGHFWFAPGMEDGGRGPLMRSTDGGANWKPSKSIGKASVIGFGKEAPGAEYPTIFIEGEQGAQHGIYRSTDEGRSWVLLAEYPLGIYDRVAAIAGDASIFGRVYIAFAGNGAIFGQPRAP